MGSLLTGMFCCLESLVAARTMESEIKDCFSSLLY